MSCRECKFYDGDWSQGDFIRCDWLYQNDNKQDNITLPPYLMVIDKTMIGVAIGTQSCYPKAVHKDTSLNCKCFTTNTEEV